MKKFVLVAMVLFYSGMFKAEAQCAMCKRTAETNIESQHKQSAAKSLNGGILYLLSIPYVIGAVGAFAWWKNRKKNS